jgi:sugar lactone lactonase YvrE
MRACGRAAIFCLVLVGACGRSLGSANDAGTDSTGAGGAAATGGAGGTAGTGGIDGGPIILTVDAGMPTTLATGAALGPFDLAVDATHVYWTDTKASAVMKVPKEGGATVTLASDQTNVSKIAVDTTYVYWTSTAGLMKVALAGGTPLPVAEMQSWIDDVATDGDSVYWATRFSYLDAGVPPGPGKVMKASRETGVVTTLTTTTLAGGGVIAVDARAVYWASSGEPFALIFSVPLAGGEATQVTGAELPGSMASDGRNLYYTNYDPQPATGGGSIMKVPVGGGVATKLVSVSGGSIVVDGSTLYWVAAGGIHRMSVDGGPVTWSPTGDQPRNLVVDQTRVYWTSAEGNVMAMAKP